uniref:NOT2/NOT3/NOT5 C-terminal domain-containing protein n=1 Tax=Ananas comosus var. bracteatus TaxID=296719 RepID=A0A6V7PZG7_ANACO|nr:unnamed protein product [Ananas comosus var. bracteatus]
MRRAPKPDPILSPNANFGLLQPSERWSQRFNKIDGNFNIPYPKFSCIERHSNDRCSLKWCSSTWWEHFQWEVFTKQYFLCSVSDFTGKCTWVHRDDKWRGINIVGNHAFISNMSGVGGSISGIFSASATAAGDRSTVPGLGISPILDNVGPQLASSLGNIVGGGANTGRSINSVGGLASRVNLAVNSGSRSLNVQGSNGLMGVPQMLGVLGNSNTASGGSLSQNQVRGANNSPSSMGMLNDVNSNDKSPFDLNDFPQLTTQRSSMGGAQGQMGLTRKQGVGVSSIVQQSQEFSIQNEDFPALPGCKGGSSDFSSDMHQKEHFHENVPMIPSQHFPMARSAGFILGGPYQSNHQQQQQHAATVSSSGVTFSTGNNQDCFQLHGSNLFPTSYGTYHSLIQNGGPSSIVMRPLSSPNQVFNLRAYEQLVQQYQHQHNLSQFRLQEMSAAAQPYREQSLKSLQGAQFAPDRFGLLGLLDVIRMGVSELASLALGIDLTTLGLNFSSSDNLYKTFHSPWSDEPAKGEPQYSSPGCYSAHPPSPLQEGDFSKFDLGTLFYIFYSMPKDEAQLYAASELISRGWLYHKEYQLWFTRVSEPLVRTNTYERASYHCFDPNSWGTIRKDNVVIYFEAVEKKPTPSTLTKCFAC